MTEPVVPKIKRCCECGAENDAYARNCWLCYSEDMLSEPKFVIAEIVEKPGKQIESQTKPAWAPGEYSAVVLVGSVTLLVIIVGLGVYSIGEGALLCYLIVTIPALLALIIRASFKQARGQQITTSEALSTFFLTGLTVMVSATAIAGLVVILAIAAFAVLIVQCFNQLSQSGGGAGS